MIDFYSFFISGLSEFQNIRIIDGDVIHIPVVEKRVSIKGEIQRQKQYELIDSESISDLIDYAGGLTSTASNKAILNNIIPIVIPKLLISLLLYGIFLISSSI